MEGRGGRRHGAGEGEGMAQAAWRLTGVRRYPRDMTASTRFMQRLCGRSRVSFYPSPLTARRRHHIYLLAHATQASAARMNQTVGTVACGQSLQTAVGAA